MPPAIGTRPLTGTAEWSDGEAVIRVPSSLQHSADPHDYFALKNRRYLDREDSDMGASGPLPIDVPTPGGGGSDAMVWVAGAGGGDNRLRGYRADTGQVQFAGGRQSELMNGLRRVTTILAAEGRLFVAGKTRLYPFSPVPNQL